MSVLYYVAGLTTVAKLLGCSSGQLNLALSTHKMRVGNDTIVQKLTLSQVKIFPLENMDFHENHLYNMLYYLVAGEYYFLYVAINFIFSVLTNDCTCYLCLLA